MIVWVFPSLAVCGILFAYGLKTHLSGRHLNNRRLFFCLFFNGLFVVPYIDIIQNNEFLFLGHRPDILSAHPFIGWLALVCIVIHSLCLPVKHTVKGWCCRK